MEANLLRAFVAVAECEGFSAAGKILNRTQSAVSLQIKRLEDQVGESLFERTSRSVTLSAAGEHLLPYAQQMLRLQDEAMRVMGAGRQGELIRLGVSEEQASAYLPELLPEMARSHPDLRLEVICDISTVLVEQFRDGFLDVALAIRHAPTQTGHLLGREPMVWVAHEDQRLDAWDILPLALNPEGCIFRANAVAALGRQARLWDVRYTSRSPTGLNLAVQSGLAVTVKTPRSIPPGCRIVGPEEGLPDLGHVEIELHTAPAKISEAFQFFHNALIRIATGSETLDAFGETRVEVER